MRGGSHGHLCTREDSYLEAQRHLLATHPKRTQIPILECGSKARVFSLSLSPHPGATDGSLSRGNIYSENKQEPHPHAQNPPSPVGPERRHGGTLVRGAMWVLAAQSLEVVEPKSGCYRKARGDRYDSWGPPCRLCLSVVQSLTPSPNDGEPRFHGGKEYPSLQASYLLRLPNSAR